MGNGERRLGDPGLLLLPRAEIFRDDVIPRKISGQRERSPGCHFCHSRRLCGVHDVIASIDGRVVAQNGVEVTQSFEMSPASGPVGTPIELQVKGLGWRTMESTWVVNWDNRG